MHRIRRLATIAMIVMLPMMLYYPYHALSWNLEVSSLIPASGPAMTGGLIVTHRSP